MLEKSEIADVLSLSQANTWVHCPGSARLELLTPKAAASSFSLDEVYLLLREKISECLLCDTSAVDLYCEAKREYELGEDTYLLPEHYVAPIDYYVDYVRSVMTDDDATLLLKHDVKFDLVLAGGQGTVDTLVIDDHTCHIICLSTQPDLLEAEHYYPLLLLALGAIYSLREAYLCDCFHLTLIQPMQHHRSSWVISHDTLLAWGKIITKQVDSAVSDQPTFSPSLTTCAPCRAQGLCKPCAEYAMTSITQQEIRMRDVNLMSHRELSEALEQVPLIKLWLEALEQQAIEQLQQGLDIPGYELVSVKPSLSWSNPQAAANAMSQLGLTERDIYRQQPLLAEQIISPDELRQRHADLFHVLGKLIKTEVHQPSIQSTASKQLTQAKHEPPLIAA